jgi:hypothetical protein
MAVAAIMIGEARRSEVLAAASGHLPVYVNTSKVG